MRLLSLGGHKFKYEWLSQKVGAAKKTQKNASKGSDFSPAAHCFPHDCEQAPLPNELLLGLSYETIKLRRPHV